MKDTSLELHKGGPRVFKVLTRVVYFIAFGLSVGWSFIPDDSSYAMIYFVVMIAFMLPSLISLILFESSRIKKPNAREESNNEVDETKSTDETDRQKERSEMKSDVVLGIDPKENEETEEATQNA